MSERRKDDLERIATLEAQVREHSRNFDRFEKSVDALNGTIQEANKILGRLQISEAYNRGARHAKIAAFGFGSSTIGGLITVIATHIWK